MQKIILVHLIVRIFISFDRPVAIYRGGGSLRWFEAPNRI